MTPLRAVLFDATGTLIELREPVGETYARIARERGVELPAWRLDDAFARVLRRTRPLDYTELPRERDAIEAEERAWWRGVVRSTFLATDSTVRFADFDGFFAATFDHYAGAGAWRLRAGAREALEQVRAAGLRAGIASNFDQRLNVLLQELEISKLFDHVTTPAACRARKPASAFFEAALAGLQVEVRETLYVGDDPAEDLEAIRALGLRVLGAQILETLNALPAYLEAHAKLDHESAPKSRA